MGILGGFALKLQIKFKIPGFADCDIEIHANGFLVAALYWANQDGPLPGWSSLAVFPIAPSGNGKYRIEGHRAIPQEATHVYAKCVTPDFSGVEDALEAIPERFLPTVLSNKAVASFTFMSDLHLSAKPGKIIRALRMAENPILIPGDLTNDGYAEQFRLFQQCIEKAGANRLILSVTGNHDQLLKQNNDVKGYDVFQQDLFDRTEGMGISVCKDVSGAYCIQHGEVDIIGLQCVAAGRKFGFSANGQLVWLEKYLNSSNATWHIILCHAPLLEHNPHRNEGNAYFSGNNELQRIVSEHNNIIFVSGHTHFSPNTRQGSVEFIPETQTIYVDAGSVRPTELSGELLMPSEWHDGVIVELTIFDRMIELTYKSVHTGKCFPRGYYRFGWEPYRAMGCKL